MACIPSASFSSPCRQPSERRPSFAGVYSSPVTSLRGVRFEVHKISTRMVVRCVAAGAICELFSFYFTKPYFCGLYCSILSCLNCGWWNFMLLCFKFSSLSIFIIDLSLLRVRACEIKALFGFFFFFSFSQLQGTFFFIVYFFLVLVVIVSSNC